MVSDIKRDIPIFGTVFTQTGATYDENTNSHKGVELWAKTEKHKTISEFRTPFFPRDIRENPRSKYARVPKAMAQFVLKIEKLSHLMGLTPILEMARAYGLRPRLWLLVDTDMQP